jgi:DNA-binding transcriptional LysR family regulator
VELRQLRYAVAVAEKRSFTKAAASEIVVQSALSQQVRKLEQELGVRLFDRTTRSVSTTSAGEALLPVIRQVLAGLDQLAAEAQAIRGIVQGQITVGLMEVPPEALEVASLIATFHQRYPGISVSVRSGGGSSLVQAVHDRELDVALVGVTDRDEDERLQSLPLLTEALVAVLPEDHELAPRRSVSLAELASFPFIDFPRGYGLRIETDRGFRDVARQVAFEVTRVELVTQFIRHGLGVAILPESVARSQELRGGLILAEISDAELTRQVRLVHPSPPALSAVGRAFVASVEEFFTMT